MSVRPIGVELANHSSLIQLYHHALDGGSAFFEENRGDVLRALRALSEASYTWTHERSRVLPRAKALSRRVAVSDIESMLSALLTSERHLPYPEIWSRISALLVDTTNDLTSDEVMSAALDGLSVR